MIQLDRYFYVNVSDQRQTGLEKKKKQFHDPWNYGACAVCVFLSLLVFKSIVCQYMP